MFETCGKYSDCWGLKVKYDAVSAYGGVEL